MSKQLWGEEPENEQNFLQNKDESGSVIQESVISEDSKVQPRGLREKHEDTQPSLSPVFTCCIPAWSHLQGPCCFWSSSEILYTCCGIKNATLNTLSAQW